MTKPEANAECRTSLSKEMLREMLLRNAQDSRVR
jgi:hypothetical protein